MVYDHDEKDLDMVVTNGQDTPATNPKTTPILLLDVWEHSYYLDVRDRASRSKRGVGASWSCGVVEKAVKVPRFGARTARASGIPETNKSPVRRC